MRPCRKLSTASRYRRDTIMMNIMAVSARATSLNSPGVLAVGMPFDLI